jgi:hypothetical protein
MQYNFTTKNDVIEIVHSAIEQGKWISAIKLLEMLLEMERNGREAVLIEIKEAPP